jgi:ATP-dependent RNA helicase DHR2
VQLLQLSALSPTTGSITPVGREMSLMPLPSYLARILLSSALPQYNCVEEIIDIVSALSVENVFLNIHNSHATQDTDESDNESSSDPRLELRSRFHRRQGDHLTLLAVIQAYLSENTDRKRWCEERGLSHRAMQAVMDARKQLTGIMKRRANAYIDKNSNKRIENGHPSTKSHATEAPTQNTNEEHAITPPNATPDLDLDTRILKTLLTGLHTNVARLSSAHTSKSPTASSSTAEYLTLSTHQPVSIHPSSVLFQPYSTGTRSRTHQRSNGTSNGTSNNQSTGSRVRPEAIMSSEYVYTTKPYARCVSAVQLDWVRDAVNEVATV